MAARPRHEQAADWVRAQVADGSLRPGRPAPSGAALAGVTGFSQVTCRRALRALIAEGVLVAGPSPNARPRVAGPLTAQEHAQASAARVLSASLARHRRALGLTQPQLALLAGVSVTTIGHAETARLWHSREFWERVDRELSAGGKLLAHHDAYRQAAAAAGPASDRDDDAAGAAEGGGSDPAAGPALVAVAVSVSGPVACVRITWADGRATVVYPPETPARPAGVTLVD